MLMVGEYEFLSGVLISVIHWNPLLCLFGYHYLICLCILSLLSLLFFSIIVAIGTPLRVDHAATSINKPSVTRVLVEYDVLQPLLPRI